MNSAAPVYELLFYFTACIVLPLTVIIQHRLYTKLMKHHEAVVTELRRLKVKYNEE